MAEQNPHGDEKGVGKIGTDLAPESMSEETKLELVENEGDSKEEDLAASTLFFIVTALMLCVFLVCSFHEIYATIYIYSTILHLSILTQTGITRPDHRCDCHPQDHGSVPPPRPGGLVRQRLLLDHRRLPINLWQDLQVFPSQVGLPPGHLRL